MLVDARTRSVVLAAPDPFAVRDAIPVSRALAHPIYNIAVKHTMTTTRILRNMGFDVPSPMMSQYTWPGKYKPFQHQRVMADFLAQHKRCFNLSEMGTGKTASSLWAADWLMCEGLVKKVLVLSPLSTLERVWMNDIFDVLMHRTAVVVHGTKQKRLDALAANVDFYILNHDGLTIRDVHDALRKNPDINLIIVDEASMFRNAKTKKYKALKSLIRPDQRLWLATGTPCPNGPTDAWALARLVNPSNVPNYFGQFQRETMMQVSQFKWVARNDAYQKAYAAMQPAVRFKKRDCLDLPPVTTQDRLCDLTADQKAAFNDMRNKMRAEMKAGAAITAVNAADKINKIRQIFCGGVKDPEKDDQYITLDHGHRLRVLLDTIDEAAAKVIVIVPFKGIIYKLAEEVSKHHSCAILNGDVPAKRRNEIIRSFKETDDPHVLLCHPKVMAHGLNLTEADSLIFYAPIYSNDEFQQVTERFNRAGQTRKMTITRIGAHAIEWQIYAAVDSRRLTQDSILSLYAAITGQGG